MGKGHMTMSEELAQRQLDAYNNRDIEAFAMCYAENVQLFRLQSSEMFCEGRDQLRQSYGTMFATHPDLHCELVKRVVCGEIAIDEEKVSGLMADTQLHAVAIYEVKDGLICRAWFARDAN